MNQFQDHIHWNSVLYTVGFQHKIISLVLKGQSGDQIQRQERHATRWCLAWFAPYNLVHGGEQDTKIRSIFFYDEIDVRLCLRRLEERSDGGCTERNCQTESCRGCRRRWLQINSCTNECKNTDYKIPKNNNNPLPK